MNLFFKETVRIIDILTYCWRQLRLKLSRTMTSLNINNPYIMFKKQNQYHQRRFKKVISFDLVWKRNATLITTLFYLKDMKSQSGEHNIIYHIKFDLYGYFLTHTILMTKSSPIIVLEPLEASIWSDLRGANCAAVRVLK